MRKILLFGHTIARVAIVLAVLPVAIGCDCIFKADFNSDMVDSPPDTMLPALPPGDWLTLDTSAGDILVRASVGDLTDQPVEVRTTGGTGGVTLLGTVGGRPPTTGTWVGSWRGMVQADSEPQVASGMVLRDSRGLILAHVGYMGGGIIDFNNLFTFSGIGVAWTPDVSQLFEVTIDLDAKTVSLAVDGVPIPSCQNLAYMDAAAVDLARMSFSVGLTTPQAFALDDLSICAVPRDVDVVPVTRPK